MTSTPKIALLTLTIAISLAACQPASEPTAPAETAPAASADTTPTADWSANPFSQPSTLPLQAPDFSKIRDEHYAPALTEAMRVQLQAVAQITANTEAPSFANTIEPLERSSDLLLRVSNVFFHMTGSYTNDTLDAINAEFAPKLAEHLDAIVLNDSLFTRVKTLHENRATLGLTPEQDSVLNRYFLNFTRNGALLTGESREQLKTLNKRQSEIITQFSQNILNASKDAALHVTDEALLAGLSKTDRDTAAAAAKEAGKDGWLFALVNTSTQPLLSKAENRSFREQLYKASVDRGAGGNTDNRPLILELTKLRADRAQLLGYKNHADYIIEDQMAKSAANARKLLQDMAGPSVAAAKRDAGELQALIDAEGGDFKLAAWDWQFYAEKLRAKKYDLNEDQVRPYFELDKVLNDGVFFAANKLFGVTFKERTDLPVYDKVVRTFDVFDANGEQLGIIYFDFFARPNKRGGAWMSNFVDQSFMFGTKPVVTNNLNVPKPADGEPVLLTSDEMNTTFHEFGHALHGLFANQQYPLQSGTSTPRDFVEFPSQWFENWAYEPEVLKNFARHHETGEVIPDALVEKIKNASSFNAGFASTEYLASSLLDMSWHELDGKTMPTDVLAFERQALEQNGVYMEEIHPRYRSTYFSHVFPGGYSAGYYSYLWCEVLDADAFAGFKERGGMTRENGDAFRKQVIGIGGVGDLLEQYTAWRGSAPKAEALMERRGFKAEATQK